MNYLKVLLILLSVVSFSGINIFAQESENTDNTNSTETDITETPLVFDKAYFEQEKFDYTWTDAEGVIHKSKLTEKATDQKQIAALLDKIYSDAEIPGTIEIPRIIAENDKLVGDTYKITYPTTPIEGTTVLLVEVRDDISGASTSPERIKSVQLLTSRVHVEADENNPDALVGDIFNIKADLNRFFFISKGKVRLNNNEGCSLFGNKFEIYSPADNKSAESTLNAYDKLKYGQSYDILHDCGVILSSNHFFHMGTSAETNSYPINICIYLPSYRMTYWNGRENAGVFTWYNPDYLPFLFTYAINLEAQAVPDTNQVDTYAVTLNWESTFDSNSKSNIPQEYYVYKVINGIIEETPLNDTPLTVPTYTYTEEQYEVDRTITYIIKGRPTTGDFDFTASNTASVTIPAIIIDDTPNIAITVAPTSNFNFKNECNDYVNTISILNDADHQICHHYAGVGSKFVIYRATDSESESVTVATIEITELDDTQEDGYNYCTYTINGETQTGKWKYKKPTDEDFHTSLEFGENGFSVIDNFSASTADNSQPAAYEYFITFTPVISDTAEQSTDISSNHVTVNIPKTTYDVAPEISFTAEQIAADTDHSLREGLQTKITLSLQNNPLIRKYSIFRDGSDTEVAYVFHNANGDFECYVKENGTFVSAGTISAGNNEAKLQDFIFTDEVSSEKAQYVAVISAYTSDGLLERTDTYGSDKKEIGVVNAELTCTEKSQEGYRGQANCQFNVTTQWDIQFNEELFTPTMYRLWRKVGDSETLIATFDSTQPIATDANSETINALASTFADSYTLKEASTASFTMEYRLRAYSLFNNECYVISEDILPVTFEIQTDIDEINNDFDFRVCGNDILTDDETKIYNINGFIVDGQNLPTGIYIVVKNGVARKVAVK